MHSSNSRSAGCFQVLGTSYRYASVETREQLAVPREQVREILRQITEEAQIRQAVLLSTPLRSEFYFCGEQADIRSALSAFCTPSLALEPESFESPFYFLRGKEAIRHLFRVVAGLDSLIEKGHLIRQAVGDAITSSIAWHTAGTPIESIFDAALECAGRVSEQAPWNGPGLSLSWAAREWVEKIFGPLAKRTVLLFIGKPAVRFVNWDVNRPLGCRVSVASPDQAVAQELAQMLGADVVIRRKDLPQAIGQADVIIQASSYGHPAVSRRTYERIRPFRRKRALILLDLAVPRGIDPSIEDFEEVFLYSIDDLLPIAAAWERDYEAALRAAEMLVQKHVDHFLRHWENGPLSNYASAARTRTETDSVRMSL